MKKLPSAEVVIAENSDKIERDKINIVRFLKMKLQVSF